MSYSKVIAIDGPSGSGKSTLAKGLAEHLKVLYVNTGAMYRALGLRGRELNIDLEKEEEVDNFLQKIDLDYAPTPTVLIQVDGKDYTQAIRTGKAAREASTIAQVPAVRHFLVGYQRALAKKRICVMEGRDIGTVVFPDAFVKFFLTASLEVRAERRWKEMCAKENRMLDLEQILEDERRRDQADTQRAHSPLKQAQDGILIDTGNMTPDELVEKLAQKVCQKAKELNLSL